MQQQNDVTLQTNKAVEIIDGSEENPEEDDITFETWEEKDLPAQLEIMTHLEDRILYLKVQNITRDLERDSK